MKKLSFLCVAALLFASCASEDNANQSNKSQQDTTNVPTVTFVGYQPETTASAKTRTTATHERGKAAKVFWEPTDRKQYLKLAGLILGLSTILPFAKAILPRSPQPATRLKPTLNSAPAIGMDTMKSSTPKCAMWAQATM